MIYKVTYQLSGGRDADGNLKVIEKNDFITAHSFSGAEEKVNMSNVFKECVFLGESFNISKIEAFRGKYENLVKISRIERDSRVLRRRVKLLKNETNKNQSVVECF